nr:DDE-type integrase/transposase/recombinase [Croceicoccus sp. YJ47]
MTYVWRAVDREGEVIESYVTKTRDKAAALHFMRNALKRHGSPHVMTTDGQHSYKAAMTEGGYCGSPDRAQGHRLARHALAVRRAAGEARRIAGWGALPDRTAGAWRRPHDPLHDCPLFGDALPGTPMDGDYWTPEKDAPRPAFNDWLHAHHGLATLFDLDRLLAHPLPTAATGFRARGATMRLPMRW